jgi:hypothetical protein
VVRSRTRNSVLRRLRAVGLLTLLALVFPASALAHTPAATVSCTGAQFTWTDFRNGSNTVHWRVTVDGATFQEGTTTFDGRVGGSQSVPFTLNDTHTVQAFSWWAANETSDGNVRPQPGPALASQTLTCPAAAPPATPPGATPPGATPPAAGNIPATQTPASAVAGTEAASATAAVRAQRSCASRTASITVSGRQIRQVTFSVNGHRVRTVRVRSSARRVTVAVPLSRGGAPRQTVTARVTFRNGAAARTLKTRATRCAQGAVSPQFTG